MVKLSRSLAWAATAVGVLLASLPGIAPTLHRTLTGYDGALAVLTATLIALIWYTQFTFEALQHARTQDDAKRKRARTTIATGLLEELKWLDSILAQIYEHGPHSFYDPLAHPMFEVALSQSALFEPETIEALAAFRAVLGDCQATVNEYRLRSSAIPSAQKPEYVRVTKIKAVFALESLPALVARLVAEGGRKSEFGRRREWAESGVPRLPESAFGLRPQRREDHQASSGLDSSLEPHK